MLTKPPKTKKSKYNNTKTKDGDSEIEVKVGEFLYTQNAFGLIKNLQKQTSYTLQEGLDIASQYQLIKKKLPVKIGNKIYEYSYKNCKKLRYLIILN